VTRDGGRSGVTALVRDPRRRRSLYLVVAVIAGILCFVPHVSVARAKLLPQDSSSAGLGQVINQLGGQLSTFASLLAGGRPPNDLYLIIGRSDPVADDVIADLHLVGPGRRYATVGAAKIDLNKKVDVHLLLGGVVEVETTNHDDDDAVALTRAYVRAISKQIGELGRQTIKSKRSIVDGRFRQSADRVRQTSAALDAFRATNRLASFETQLTAQITLRTDLQSRLQTKLVELSSISQSAGPESVQLQAIRAEVAALRGQLANADRPTTAGSGANAQGLSTLQSQYLNLYRDYKFSQSLYEVYARAVEQTEVESLVSETATYIQIVEPAHLDPHLHLNLSAVGVLAGLVLLVLFTELYAPATGLGWPGQRDRLPDDAT